MKEQLKNVRIFEVDYGPTQEYKKRRINDVLGCAPNNVTFVSIDFSREQLIDVLQQAGYERNRHTLFIWEGVTY